MRARMAMTLALLVVVAGGRHIGAAAETTAGEASGEATEASAPPADDKDAKKTKELTIDDVMRYAMTRHLVKKVAKKQATLKEQKQLVKLLQALSNMKPPKGSLESWKEKTGALVTAAEEIVAGEPSHQALMKAANCAACHKVHRP